MISVDLHTRAVLAEIESRILQIATDLEQDPNYSNQHAIEELIQIVDYINSLKAPVLFKQKSIA